MTDHVWVKTGVYGKWHAATRISATEVTLDCQRRVYSTDATFKRGGPIKVVADLPEATKARDICHNRDCQASQPAKEKAVATPGVEWGGK